MTRCDACNGTGRFKYADDECAMCWGTGSEPPPDRCRACGGYEGTHARLCSVRQAMIPPLVRAREEVEAGGSLIGVSGAGEIDNIRRAVLALIEHAEGRP